MAQIPFKSHKNPIQIPFKSHFRSHKNPIQIPYIKIIFFSSESHFFLSSASPSGLCRLGDQSGLAIPPGPLAVWSKGARGVWKQEKMWSFSWENDGKMMVYMVVKQNSKPPGIVVFHGVPQCFGTIRWLWVDKGRWRLGGWSLGELNMEGKLNDMGAVASFV